jgi:hypothetical protein
VNINALTDSRNDAGFDVTGCPAGPGARWRGASVRVSLDGGATYSVIGSIVNESTRGEATNALGDFTGGNIPDEINSLNVAMTAGTLSGTTWAGMLSGVLTLVVGEEIIYGRDVTLELDGTYTVRGLLRGRRGTGYAMSLHEVGERVVLYDPATFVRITQETADIGIERLYKCVSAGGTLAATPSQTFTNEGRPLMPHAPVLLGGGRDASNNATLQWVRSNRDNFAWRDSVEVPMSEDSESYAVDIFSDGTFTTVIDTLTSSVESVAYSASDQTLAGITPGDPIYFGVVQISAVVGRGYMAYGSI